MNKINKYFLNYVFKLVFILYYLDNKKNTIFIFFISLNFKLLKF
jgi:hypothetical protein